MATQPPIIDPVPTPPIQRGDRVTFSGRVDAFIRWLVNAVGQFSAVATNVYSNTIEAFQSATTAAAAASAATQAASVAVNSPGTNGTSTTSLSVSLGTKNLTIAQTGKGFNIGNTVSIASTASPANKMDGNVTAFNSQTGEMVVNVTNLIGSGTFSSWVISVAGAPGATGIINEQLGAPVASASTINLTSVTGNFVHITGTATINAITIPLGAQRELVFDASLTLTNGVALLLPGAANIVTRPGDRCIVRGDSNGAIITQFQRADGTQVVTQTMALIGTATVAAASPVAAINFPNVFSAQFDKYVIEVTGLAPSAASLISLRLAAAGAIDTASRYYSEQSSSTAAPTAQDSFTITSMAASAAGDISFTVDVGNVNQALRSKYIAARGFYLASNSAYDGINCSGGYTGGIATGFSLFAFSGSNLTGGTVRVYGVRNS